MVFLLPDDSHQIPDHFADHEADRASEAAWEAFESERMAQELTAEADGLLRAVAASRGELVIRARRADARAHSTEVAAKAIAAHNAPRLIGGASDYLQ